MLYADVEMLKQLIVKKGISSDEIFEAIDQCTVPDRIQGKPSYDIDKLQRDAELCMEFDI